MFKKIRDSKFTHIALSVLIAVALWLYVGNVENPDVQKRVSNLSVTFEGLEALTEQGLIMSSFSPGSVALNLRGKQRPLLNASSETIKVSANLSHITLPGKYRLVYEVQIPANPLSGSVVIESRTPVYLDVLVSKLAKKTVPVRGVFSGGAAEGYELGEMTFYPAEIEVSGAEEAIGKIESALVAVSRHNLSRTIRDIIPYSFIDTAGQRVAAAPHIRANVSEVVATLPVFRLAEVPLSVSFLSGGGVAESDIFYDISPRTIRVSGGEDLVSSLTEISIGTVNLGTVAASSALTIPIVLPEGVRNVLDIEDAVLSITLPELATRVYDVTDIEFLNTPAGYRAESVNASCQVLLRGKRDVLDAIGASQIKAVVDLGKISLRKGRYTLPADIILEGAPHAGVIEEHTILVSVEPS